MSKSKRHLALAVRGRGPGRPYSVTAPGREIVEKMLANSPALRAMTPQKLGRFLAQWLARFTTGQHRGWRFPPLADLRSNWEAKHGSREWPEGVDEWPVEVLLEEVRRDLPF